VDLLNTKNPQTREYVILQFTKKRHGKQRGIRMINRASLLEYSAPRRKNSVRGSSSLKFADSKTKCNGFLFAASGERKWRWRMGRKGGRGAAMMYRQLNAQERFTTIASLRTLGISLPEIAAVLKRHRSTVWREVGRNCAPYDGGYRSGAGRMSGRVPGAKGLEGSSVLVGLSCIESNNCFKGSGAPSRFLGICAAPESFR
jgi:hypothetical protein